MIGQVALTKDKGQLFLIIGTNTAGFYTGLSLIQTNKLGVITESEPKVMCSLMDILDYSKIADQTIKLIHRESDEKEAKEDSTKSLGPIEEDEEQKDESLTL